MPNYNRITYDFQRGDRVRLIDPRADQMHMQGWEGEIIECREDSETVRVRLEDPNGMRQHTEGYYRVRLQLVDSQTLTSIERTIHRLQKRQKFYQTYKKQLPTWYAAYGD